MQKCESKKKHYILRLLSLVKHGIILGNIIPLIAGFLLALKFFPRATEYSLLLINAVLWSSIVIAGGCVVNNWYDKDIDSKMQRTCQRVLPMGEVPSIHALIFGIILMLAGLCGLFFFVNTLSSVVALFGLVFYVIFYTIIAKRNSIYGVHIGSISGAIPPVIGYVAISGVIDINSAMLFIIMVLWQMPHSFAIETFRYEDYLNAKIPTVPSVKGLRWMQVSSAVYIILFLVANIYLSLNVGSIYFITSLVLCSYWLKSVRKFPKIRSNIGEVPTDMEKSWARKVFFGSIFTMVGIFLSMILNLVV